MLKECLDCTAKFSKRAKISVLLLLLCIFSGWGWFEGVGAFCDPLPVGWMQWGCGNGSLSSGESELCSTLLWGTCPTAFTSGIRLLSCLSLRKESFSFFSTLQNWWQIWPLEGLLSPVTAPAAEGADLRSPSLLWELHGGCSSAGTLSDAQKCLTQQRHRLHDVPGNSRLLCRTWQHRYCRWENKVCNPPSDHFDSSGSLQGPVSTLGNEYRQFSASYDSECTRRGVWWQRCDRWLYYLWLRKKRVISWRSFKMSTKESSKHPTNLCECFRACGISS